MPQFHSDPVSQPLGASDEASAWYPTEYFPAASVALMIVDVQSWCWVMTSTPWDSRLLAASVCLPGSHHAEVLTTEGLAAGFTDCAPSSKASMLSIDCEMGKA